MGLDTRTAGVIFDSIAVPPCGRSRFIWESRRVGPSPVRSRSRISSACDAGDFLASHASADNAEGWGTLIREEEGRASVLRGNAISRVCQDTRTVI
jgi:hypothetical protein